VRPILLFGSFFFVAGVLFAYFQVVPAALRFLIRDTAKFEGMELRFNVSDTLKFETVLLLVFGFAFELPVVVVTLTRLGVITPEMLAKRRRLAIVIMFVAGALLTPPDVITQVMLAGPLVILLEISIQASKFFRPKHTIWGPYDDEDYADTWAEPASPTGGTGVGSDRLVEPDAQPKLSAPPKGDQHGEEAAGEHDEDYSYEQEDHYDEESDPYAYGEDAYQAEDWEEDQGHDDLERLRKDLRRRRTSRRRRKRPGPQRGQGRRRRPNL
jgi:hypothetical protein